MDSMNIKRIKLSSIVMLALLLRIASVYAEDGVLTMESTITGSQEQPKMLYIVPWQNVIPGEPVSQEVASKVIERQIFSPIDRAVFQRQIRYHELLLEAAQRRDQGNIPVHVEGGTGIEKP